ncbi:alpha/beta fold hydrolase [Streptomyces cavourensis]
MTTTDRTAPRTGLLTVDGAILHHEVRGEGPLLVMMPGGSADAGIYDAIAAAMTTMAEGLTPAWGEDRAAPEPAAVEAGAAAREPEPMAPEPERAIPEPEPTAPARPEGPQGVPPEVPPAQAEVFRRMHANLPVFLEHVLCSFSGYVPDLVALKTAAAPLVVGVGRDSRALLPAVAAEALARRVDARAAEFPGGHIGLTEAPRAFAARLRDVLLAP